MCVVLTLASGASASVSLLRLETVPAGTGATVRLRLSGAAQGVVRAEAGAAGTTSRIYLDLPPGTRLAPGVLGAATTLPPVASLRAGLGEGGVLRVVVALRPAATYRLEHRPNEIQLQLSAPAPPPVAALRGAEPPGAHPPAAPKVVIDAGHGGDDPGALGHAVEKEVTLAIAIRLARLLRERLGADAILTRSRDATLSLAARTARANAEAADLFLSIHSNASENPELRGVETYYLNNTDDRAAIRLAAMENGLDLITPADGGTDLRYILSDLVQVGKMEESVALARALQGGLVRRLRTRYSDVTDLGVKRGPFYVLVGAYMPCALVETSFLTHAGEGRRLSDRAYQDAVAEGLYDGIVSFLKQARQARTL